MSDDITIPDVSHSSPWAVARWVLMLSHLYYDRNVSIVDDGTYDDMCRQVAEHFDELPAHEQFLIGDTEELRYTGIGFALSRLVIAQADQLAKDVGEKLEPYAFEAKGLCDCCDCELTLIRG